MSFSHVFAKRPLIDFLDVLRRDQTFRMILLAHPLSFLPLHLYLTTTVRHGMVYCCCASFLNILLEDIYYNGPENDLASTAGDQNTEEIQNIPSEVAPTIPTTQATGTAEPPLLLPSPLVSCQRLTMPRQLLRLQQFLRHLTSFHCLDDHSVGRIRRDSTSTSSGNVHAMSTQRYIQTVG